MGDLRSKSLRLPEEGLSAKATFLRLCMLSLCLALCLCLLAGLYIFLRTHGTEF